MGRKSFNYFGHLCVTCPPTRRSKHIEREKFLKGFVAVEVVVIYKACHVSERNATLVEGGNS